MNSIRLSYLIALSKTHSISKAASVLNITAAALSKAIKQMESELGFALVAPSGRGIRVTIKAQLLAEKLEPLLINIDKIIKSSAAQEKTSPMPSLRIASYEMFSTHLLPSLLATLDKNTPATVLELLPGELENALQQQATDYVITTVPRPTSGVTHELIGQFKFGIFGRKHTFEQTPLSELPFASPIQQVKNSHCQIQTLDQWPSNTQRYVRYQVNMMESALALCRAGLAVVHLPEFVIKHYNRYLIDEGQLVPLNTNSSPPLTQPLYLAYCDDLSKEQHKKAIRQTLQTLVQ